MIALEIEFPAGRFHATPWDRAVNEGDVEWPPSPWRILRALVAGWYTAQAGANDAQARRRLTALLDRLVVPPRFVLPPGVASHTRHFMPLGNQERALVLDAFVAVERTALAYIVWDTALLDEQQRADLAVACSGISYLGRAESWCYVHCVDSVPADVDRFVVDLSSRTPGEGPESRRLGIDPNVAGDGLLDALSTTTAVMRRAGKATPHGSLWLTYRFPPGFGLVASAHTRAARQRSSALPCGGVLRFVLEARTDALRPAVTETLTVAETFRSAVMSRYSRRVGGEAVPSELSGKLDDKPLAGHRHPYILPRDLDGDGRIDHVDVWIKQGPLDHDVFVAMTGVSKLYAYRFGEEEFGITYLGSAPPEKGREWKSATPFLLGAHPASRARASQRAKFEPENQVARSLREHEISQHACAIELTSPPSSLRHARGGETTLSSFRVLRKHDRAIGLPLQVTLRFDEEVAGPIALGRYAHFGMGQFVPDDG